MHSPQGTQSGLHKAQLCCQPKRHKTQGRGLIRVYMIDHAWKFVLHNM